MHRLSSPLATCTHASCAGRSGPSSSQRTVAAELGNIENNVASIPDTLNYLEGYFDDYDYDLEQLYEDAAAVRGHCLAGHSSFAQLCQKGLNGIT